MSVRVERHPFDRAFIAELRSERFEGLARHAERARTSATQLSRLHRHGLEAAGLQAGVDAQSPLARQAMSFAAQAGAAMFALAAHPPGAMLDLPLGGETVRLATTCPDSTTHARRWCGSYFAALITRDQASLGRLVATPLSVPRRVVTGDAARFNPALNKALGYHRKYWTTLSVTGSLITR